MVESPHSEQARRTGAADDAYEGSVEDTARDIVTQADLPRRLDRAIVTGNRASVYRDCYPRRQTSGL